MVKEVVPKQDAAPKMDKRTKQRFNRAVEELMDSYMMDGIDLSKEDAERMVTDYAAVNGGYFSPADQLRETKQATRKSHQSWRNEQREEMYGEGDVQYSARDIPRVNTDGVTPATEAESRNLDMLDARNLARYTAGVTSVLEKTMPSGKMLLIGNPTPILQNFMKSDKPLYIPQGSIRKAVFDTTVKGGKHGLGRVVIDDLPYQFSAPMAITGNTSEHVQQNDNSIVVWTDWMTEAGDSIIVPIRIDANGAVGLYNNVNTAFDVYNEDYFADLLREGNILYTENNRSIQDLLALQRRQVPKVQEELNASGNNIPQNSEESKTKTPHSDIARVQFAEREGVKTFADWASYVENMSPDDALNVNSENTYVPVRATTPKHLIDAGAQPLPMIMRFDALYLAVNKSGPFDGHYHNLGAAIMERLPDLLEDPDLILEVKNKKDGKFRLNVVVGIPTKTGELLASVEINAVRDIGDKNAFYNIVVTAFDVKKNYFKNLFSKYGATVKYKKESLPQVNNQLHEWLAAVNGNDSSDDSVPQDHKESNSKSPKSDREYDGTAILKETTIDRYLKDYAAPKSPSYAQAYIVYMRPDQFLRLTTKDSASRFNIEMQSKGLPVETAAKYSAEEQPLFLRINHATGEVLGHEGRHRISAFREAGINRVPVLLFDSTNKNSKIPMDSLTLYTQDFGQPSVLRQSVEVSDILPLSYANREEIIRRFGTKSSMQRAGERFGNKTVLQYSERDNAVTDRQLLSIAETDGLSEAERTELTKYREKLERYNLAVSRVDEQLNKLTKAVRNGADKASINKLRAELTHREHYMSETLQSVEVNEQHNATIHNILVRERELQRRRTRQEVKVRLRKGRT